MGTNQPNRYAKVFGMPRSGTTFVSWIFKSNFDLGVHLIHYGGKHVGPLTLREMRGWIEERPWIRDKFLPVLDGVIHPFIVIKNPYSWEQSIKKFSSGMDTKPHYMAYNKNYRVWKNLIENPHKPFGKGFVIRYEDVLVNPEAIFRMFRNIVNKTGLKMKVVESKEFIIPKRVNYRRDEFTEERRQFYLSGGTFGLPNEAVKKITNIVDWELMKFYGYKPIK